MEEKAGAVKKYNHYEKNVKRSMLEASSHKERWLGKMRSMKRDKEVPPFSSFVLLNI